MAGVEQNRYKTNNGCIKHLPQTGYMCMPETSDDFLSDKGNYIELLRIFFGIFVIDSTDTIQRYVKNSCQNENYITDSPQLLIILLFDFSESVDKLTLSKTTRFPINSMPHVFEA